MPPSLSLASRMKLVCGAALLCVALMPAHSQEPARLNVADNVAADSNGIVFLHVRLGADGTLTLLDTQTRPGVLKNGTVEGYGHTVRCQIVSTSGTVLWTANVEDPSVKRVEWEDPAQPGHLLSKLVETPGTEFMVRVPRYAKQQRVEFRRLATATAVAQTAAVTTDNKKADRLIGTFDLTLP